MNKYKAIFSAFVLGFVFLSSCNNEGTSFDNQMFIDGDTYKNEVRVATDENMSEMTKTMTVSIAQPLDYDIEISVVKSPELLDTYRKAYYDENAELLPEKYCDISSVKSVIKSGFVSSSEMEFKFVNLNDGLDYTKTYVLPVSIVSDKISALPRAKTMYFVIKEAALVNDAAYLASNCAWPEWGSFNEVKDMTHFTLEALVQGLAFDNESSIHTIMGIEDCFLLRVGDAGLATNQLQVAYAAKDDEDKTYRGSITSSNLQLEKGKWYHIAVTFDGGEDKADGAKIKVYFDGKLRAEGNCKAETGDNSFAIKSVNFMVNHSDEMDGKPRCFWIGYSYNSERWFDGLMSEVRVWKKVLSEEELNAPNHFYKLYPDSSTGQFDESLVAYWKFNEGKGAIIKDWSIYGNDLTVDHDPAWYSVSLP